MRTQTEYPATEPMIRFIKILRDERAMDVEVAARLNLTIDAGMTFDLAKSTIKWLKAQPLKATAATVEPEAGVYVLADGTIVKVVPNKSKTGVFAKVWTSFNGTRLTLTGEVVTARWEYAPGLVREVDATMRMTLEQAKAFTELYSQCARCGRKLKAAQSVLDGIGPICIKHFSF